MRYTKTTMDEFVDNSELYYNTIFKRKSFHKFNNILKISNEEIKLIEQKYKRLLPLIFDIKTEIKIVPASETTSNVGAEYCILFYSEKKDNYLQNIGYLGEQLDLFLPSMNIATLWCGMGKPSSNTFNGLDYVIMMCIAKVNEDDFTRDIHKPKKSLEEIYSGNEYKDILDIARLAPSARNSQPWKVVDENPNGLLVYRDRKPNAVSDERRDYFNNIDIGIFMCYLDVILKYKKVVSISTICLDSKQNQNEELVLNARYVIRKDLSLA